jgi:hypothetical protein
LPKFQSRDVALPPGQAEGGDIHGLWLNQEQYMNILPKDMSDREKQGLWNRARKSNIRPEDIKDRIS